MRSMSGAGHKVQIWLQIQLVNETPKLATTYLFGSTARGDARPDSDVDLFFDYEKGKLGLFQLMDVKARTASILGRKTDIMTRDSLHRTLRPQIEAAAVLVF